MNGRQGLLSFESTNIALKAERVLKDSEIPCAVIPTPIEITVDCGIALLIHETWVEAASVALMAGGCVGYELVFPYGGEDPDRNV